MWWWDGTLPVALNCEFGSAIVCNFILVPCLRGRAQLMSLWRAALSCQSVHRYEWLHFCVVVLELVLVSSNAFPELTLL